MDSIDTAHVNPNPDPDSLWTFELLKPPTEIVRGAKPLTLQVMEIAPPHRPNAVYVEMVFESKEHCDWLNLDRPCVAVRRLDGQPAITFTVRSIDTATESCKIQVTSNLPQGTR